VLAEHVRQAQQSLPVPLALEHVAAVFEWPDAQMSAPDFLCRLLDATDCLLVLDVANLHADAINFGRDPLDMLDRLPLERVVRALVAGGPLPPGFDAPRIELTRESLLRKRARGVAGHWPALGATPGFQRRFIEWAGSRPPESGHAEGLAFGQHLGRDLPAAARVERVLAGEGRVARDAGGLVLRIPLLGVRRFSGPWRRA
jgi:hypothetical protein